MLRGPVASPVRAAKGIDVKKAFFTFFLFLSRFTFLTFFYFPNVFYFKKNAGKVQSGKQIN